MLPPKTTLTIGAFLLAAAIMPNGIHPSQLVSALTLVHRAPPKVVAPVIRQIPQPIPDLEIPPGSLDTFYASLRAGKVTRILHYGDSPTTADSITSDIRRLLQKRFGDAGHGFLLIAKPWAWYGHDGIRLDAKGWEIQPASQKRAPDGIHGLGGVSFIGGEGAMSRVGLPDDKTTSAVVYYLAQPGGGTFTVSTDDAKITEVNTRRSRKEVRLR